jgi:predicted secreted hydrolase
MTSRRAFTIALLAARAGALAIPARAFADASALRFPADHGAHRDARIEWWYLTGALEAAARTWGFQITFFRATTGVAGAEASRFAARELLFAHAAVSDLEAQRLRHDQRIARSGFGVADAAVGDAALVIGDWRLARADRGGGRYTARATSASAGFAFDLALTTTQPLLAQGSAGISRKGPRPEQTSHYYSEPQLAAVGTLSSSGRAVAVSGRAWLDHEWSDDYLDPAAVGWDWIGMNLDDGAALTAFRLRRADGSSVYAGGSHRAGADAVTRQFGPAEVVFVPGRIWESPASRARYPVQWTVQTPVGRYTVQALFDDQELDSSGSTGAIYWEGLSDLLDAGGGRVGRGYLELTGYARPLRL